MLSQNMDVTVYIDRGKKVFSLEVLIGIFAHSYTNALISTYAEVPEIESSPYHYFFSMIKHAGF